MKSFMTMFSAANARGLRIGLVGLAATAIATIIGISLVSASLFSVRLPQASPAVSANGYAPLDQKARQTGYYYTTQDQVAAPAGAATALDVKARQTGYYYTTQDQVAAPAGAATALDVKARQTGYYYTTQNVVR